STATQIYDPVSNTFYTGPTLPITTATGAFAFQRSDGKFVVVCGNLNSMVIDVGWNLTGSYVTEQIYAPNLSSNTALYWKNVGGGALNAEYKTAPSQVALGQAAWNQAEKDGSLINPASGDQYV